MGHGVIGEEGGLSIGPQTDKTSAATSLYRSIFKDNEIWLCILSGKSFYVKSALWSVFVVNYTSSILCTFLF
jgi:hypothetical protein